MGVIGTAMRIFSYLYHLVLAVFMLGVSILAWSSGTTLQIGILPWDGNTLRYVLLFGGIAALIAIALAVTRILPVLFLLWTVAVFFFLFRGYVFSPYQFAEGGLKTAILITLGALVAIVGAYLQVRSRPQGKFAAKA